MSATNLQLNWKSVSFGGSAITKVTSCMFDKGGSLLNFSGDNDRYPTVIANAINNPKCSITSGDVGTLMALVPGTGGTVLGTHIDGKGNVGGDVNFTMVNGVHENSQDSGSWGQWGVVTASFNAFSSDGSTPPLSLARS